MDSVIEGAPRCAECAECAVQGAMFVSDAMMIPSSLGTSLKQSENGTMTRVPGSPWVRPSWPLAGTSIGRQTPHFGMGTSPFGKSVDMVDVCKQLMDGVCF